MSRHPLDLTGQWDGLFSYPGDAIAKTPFVAKIEENAGAFTGHILEPNQWQSGQIEAVIDGDRTGTRVAFTKAYRTKDPEYSGLVAYSGEISDSGERISGSWSLKEWSGTFEMTREPQLAVRAKQKAAVEVD